MIIFLYLVTILFNFYILNSYTFKKLLLDCSQSPIFLWDCRCRSIVEFYGPPSWYLDASETGESTKCPRVVRHPRATNLTHSIRGHFVLSPQVSQAPRDQDGGPSNSTIDIYDLGFYNSFLSVLIDWNKLQDNIDFRGFLFKRNTTFQSYYLISIVRICVGTMVAPF